MQKQFLLIISLFILVLFFQSCSKQNKQVQIGVSLGASYAERWEKEKFFMEQRAQDLGANIDVRLNRNNDSQTQIRDCIELIDKGIDVLIMMPRNSDNVGEILKYAKSKDVPVINYARVIMGKHVDLFVGYDSARMGQHMGQFITETAYEGDYIILRGDGQDNNATLLYEGAMRYIKPIEKNINIILDAEVENWRPERAKELVKKAIIDNNGKINAILAPNDKIAGACAEVIEELGIKNHVVITGMDAELDALKRIVAGKQEMTISLDLRILAYTAVEEAIHIAKKEKVNVNAEFNNFGKSFINANLISGQVIIRENLDRKLIDKGYFTRQEIYGDDK